MIRLRTASALAAGAVAALAIGGTALAADDDPTVPMLPNGDVVSPPPLFSSPSPSPSASSSPSASPSESSSASPSESSSASPSGSPSESPSASSSPADARAISLDAARTIAVRAAGGGRVESVERETEHGRMVWDVDVIVRGVEHDIDVDRATGEVTRHRVKDSGGESARSGSDDSSGDDRGRGRGRGRGSDD